MWRLFVDSLKKCLVNKGEIVMSKSSVPILYVIIPCYNEEDVLPKTFKMFGSKINELIAREEISDKSRLLFVNDGSTDETWNLIKKMSNNDTHFVGISQSRNRGHQNAVYAGLMEAKDLCDITISIDCDGQDDINAIDEMINEWKMGNEIVYGVRNKRESDTFFKRFTAESFYHLMNKMGTEVVFNHADYRLASSRVLQEFSKYEERNLFLRGMFPLIGFQSSSVYYERNERIAGNSHYPLKKMVALAIDGITSLSIKPIRAITLLGFIIASLSFIAVIWSIIVRLAGHAVEGWASMTSLVCFLGGIQLLSLGVIGEYIGKIYIETKRRPRYIISEKTKNFYDS